MNKTTDALVDFASQLSSLRADQQARWQGGDRVPVETYLAQHPHLRTAPPAVLDLIENEIRLRQELGEYPEPAEYVRRFHLFEAQLQQFFQMPTTQALPASGMSPVPPAVPERDKLPTIPGYDVIAELGRGGMGVVYQARQHSLKRLVALKMILVGADETARVRFRTEAEAVARLQHPNVVHIHEVGEHDGRPFLSLEHVEGGTLQQKVAHVAQPEREAARLVATLARAMHYTHQRGILHRDLKPNNILLTADGTPKITDFGLAKLLDQGGGPTRAEALIGTPNYMPPEQAAGDIKKIGVPADVYSLGAILYELLTGRAPFKGTTLLNTLEQVRTQEPVAPRRLRRPISRDLETICLKCLEKEPGRRYASAEALADDLQRFLDGESIRARPLAIWQQLWRRAHRRPARAACLVAVAAALLCLVLAGWSQVRVAGQLTRHQAEEKYQQFVERRDLAFFQGLLAPEQGTALLGGDAVANARAAESAARQALALAGIDGTRTEAPALALPPERRAAVVADCYALLLMLAALTGQAPAGEAGNADNEEPLRILDRARGLGFETRTYHLRRAQFLELSGNTEEAGAEGTSRVYALDGALDFFLAGEEQYRRGDWPAAKASFERALASQPDHFWARFFLAVCHLKTRHWEAAKAGLGACINQQPRFVWAYLFRSFAYEKTRALPEAEADFQRALALDPNEDARYVLLLTRGIFSFNQHDLDRAEADFLSALALRPRQYNAYLNLAQVRLAQQRFDDAADLARQAMELQPPIQVLVGYVVERGRHLCEAGRSEEALAESARALTLAPEQPQIHEVRARALLALARYQQAEAAFDHYLRAAGQPLADIFRGRGLARMKLGKYPEAAEDYTRALEREPDSELYEHRGWAHFFADALKLAERDFGQALALDAAAGDAYTGRGLARAMLGSYREASADAVEALRLKPGTPAMMHNIACIFALAAVRAAAAGPDDGRHALAKSYREQALDAIGKTLTMLPEQQRPVFFRDKVLTDHALASLHDEDAFRAWRRQYGP